MSLPEPLTRLFALIDANPYFAVPYPLYPKQLLFLTLQERQALFGGAAFGGKTIALMARLLLYAHVPGYAAVGFRRTYPELSEPGGMIDLSKQWLGATDAVFHEGKATWTFPVGQLPLSASDGVATPNSTLRFKHIQHDKDADKLARGATYQTMVWDELTTFTKKQYTSPQARLRRPAEGPLSRVPLAARAGTNPGGEGHVWVKEDFLDQPRYWNRRLSRMDIRRFIPARIADNVKGDGAGYLESLEAALDPVELARMMDGDWDVTEIGEIFDPAMLRVVQPDEVPDGLTWIRAWDTAGSVSEQAAWTVGARMAWDHEKGVLWISDLIRFRLRPGARDDAMLEAAAGSEIREGDGVETAVLIEKGTSDSGLSQEEDHMRVFAGFNVQCISPRGDKVTRAWPLARQWNKGNVRIVSGPWVGPLRSEAQLFNAKAKYKDQIDSLSLGFNNLALAAPSSAYTSKLKKRVPSGRARIHRQKSRRVF